MCPPDVKTPRPAPPQAPPEVLEQVAPEATEETKKKSRRPLGTKAYRAGTSLAIPSTGSGLNIPS